MDPFEMLPPELRLKIFTFFRSEQHIRHLAQASPAMLCQYQASKTYIYRKVLELDDGMVQDAVAIIKFPSWNPTETYAYAVRDHMALWVSQQLPNPLKTKDEKLLYKMCKLESRLLLFIEDYLTKATAIFPPREFLGISPLLSNQGYLWFKGQKLCSRFDIDDLTDNERKSLLRAFLRYELLCKVICANGLDDSFEPYYYFPKLREEVFDLVSPTKEPKREDYNGIDMEVEALLCVKEYLKSLYGSIFAQWSDSWLPDIPDLPFNYSRGLIYPDNLYFNADAYASDISLGYWDQAEYSQLEDNGLTKHLAILGFDAAAVFLRSKAPSQPGLIHLRNWVYELAGAADNRNGEQSIMTCIIFRSGARKVHRQRAWIFFDDSRLYPSSRAEPHLPHGEADMAYYRSVYDLDPIINCAFRRELSRSQEWHDKISRGAIFEGWIPPEEHVGPPLPFELEKGFPINIARFWE